MIIDHLGIGVSDYERAKAFYTEALAPLGITMIMEVGPEQTENHVHACGFAKGGKPEFWIGSDGKTSPPAHIVFVVDSREEVRAFHKAALRAGAVTTARQASDLNIIRATMAPSFSIWTATTSRPSATTRNERKERALMHTHGLNEAVDSEASRSTRCERRST
jgi:catechol 2,3-dioxygenase-like lactoylglutathione lyase family enzyme